MRLKLTVEAPLLETGEYRLGRLTIRPDLSGALWLPNERTLVVADLHLGKGSSFAARGVFLPPYDTAATLAALGRAIQHYGATRVIALGDSFHDTGAPERLALDDLRMLRQLQRGRDWLWITGNHDPVIGAAMNGDVAASYQIAGVMLRHEPEPDEPGHEIAGHLHPAAKVRSRGGALRRRCFALSSHRCILPAMGAYAGGLNLCDEAFKPLFRHDLTAHMLGDSRLFRVARHQLFGD